MAERSDEDVKCRKMRIVKCDTCKENDAKYTCPCCSMRSCCLDCVKKHKIGHKCSGQRDRVAYVAVRNFQDKHLLNDYYFLEDVARLADSFKRDPLNKPPRKNKRKMLTYFRNESRKMGIKVKILPEKFSKRLENSSYWHFKNKCILWHIKWSFPQEDAEYTEDGVNDTFILASLLRKFVHPADGDPLYAHRLKSYRDTGFQNIHVLLKNECTQTNNTSYFVLDKEKSLRDNLIGKTVVEFPTLLIVLQHALCKYLDRNNKHTDHFVSSKTWFSNSTKESNEKEFTTENQVEASSEA